MCSGFVSSSRSGVSRSVIHPTRLETRTKESNMCASLTVLNRPVRRIKRNEYDPVYVPFRRKTWEQYCPARFAL